MHETPKINNVESTNVLIVKQALVKKAYTKW